MGSFSIWHWGVALLVVALVFGTRNLRNLGSDLGGTVKGFREGMKSYGETPEQVQHGGVTIEGGIKRKPHAKA